MKSRSGDASSYNGKQLPEPFNGHRRPRSANSNGGQNRHGNHQGDGRPTRQTALQVPHHGDGRARPASSSPAVGDRKREPLVAVSGRRVRVIPPSYYDAACPTPRGRNDTRRHGHPTEVFVVPSSPILLPPSARLDRIISPVPSNSDSHRRPPDDHDDVGNWDASATDDDDRRVSHPTIFDVILRHRSLVAAVVCVCAFLSPIVMVSIPRPTAVDDSGLSYRRRLTSDSGYKCDEDCESAILSLSIRLIVVAIGSLAAFACCSPRRMWSAAELPRLEDVETTLTAVVVLIAIVFWSFYAVRIAGRGDADYGCVVSFAGSMSDTLLFVHGLAALVLGLRYSRPTSVDLVVHVVRSTDGRSTTFSVQSMSIQQLALLCLRRCCVELGTESDKNGLCTRTILALRLHEKLLFC